MIEDFNSASNSWQAKLPSIYKVKQMYSFFRSECFDNLIPPVEEVTIQWDERTRGPAGKCSQAKKKIRLSPHYFIKYDLDELWNILRHEMIHLLIPNHGPNFYAWLDKLSAKGYPTSRFSKEVSRPEWIYTCPTCEQEFEKARRLQRQSYCLKCGPVNGLLREQKIMYTDDSE